MKGRQSEIDSVFIVGDGFSREVTAKLQRMGKSVGVGGREREIWREKGAGEVGIICNVMLNNKAG